MAWSKNVDNTKGCERLLHKTFPVNKKKRLLIPSGGQEHNITTVILRIHLSYLFEEVRLVDHEEHKHPMPDLFCQGAKTSFLMTGAAYTTNDKRYNLVRHPLSPLETYLIEVKTGAMNGAKTQLRTYEQE